MRKRLLLIWRMMLTLLIVEVFLYGCTGYIYHVCQTFMWNRFNTRIQMPHDADQKVLYAASINRYARRTALNPQVVVSLIQAESSFQPKAISSAGAYGLMQIMPDTWRQINKEFKVCHLRHEGDCTSVCYQDADLNIQIGTYYLARLLARYQGNMILALAAYNAGPAAVDHYGGVPPYAETIQYTERVIKNYYQISNEKIPYSDFFVKKNWDKVNQVIGWSLMITLLLMIGVLWRLKRLQSSWYWR